MLIEFLNEFYCTILPYPVNLPIDCKAPNIIFRSRRLYHLCTGFRLIDCLFPIALGQRELIIGDRQTGKTTLCISSIIIQLSYFYEYSTRYIIFGLLFVFLRNVLLSYAYLSYYVLSLFHISLIIFVSVTESMSLQYLSPIATCVSSEFYRNLSFHVL